MMRYRVLTMLLGCLVLLTGLAGCGGGGGGGNAPGETPPISPPSTPRSTVLVTGRAHAGTPARPLALAPCRFVAQDDPQPLAEAATDQVGAFELDIPLDRQGFILCHPAAIPSLELSAFVSTFGQTEGGHLPNEDVTPASAVIADVIRANDPMDPQAQKEALLAALARAETDITVLVEAATLLYQTLFDARTGSDADFSGISAEGGDSAEADSGGAEGEAGDGGEFSPLPGALCTFSLDAAGLVRTNTMLGDLYADGQIDRVDLQAAAAPVNKAIDAERRRAITQAFAALFPVGIGPSLAAIADGNESMTPGRYFLPIPAGVPGVVTCIPDNLDQLVLHTCVRARARNEVLDAEDVTPISTVVCEIANEVRQSGTAVDRETTKLDLLGRLAPLRIFLSEDRNGNGVQDADEKDKNGDGEFATIVELESDEPLTENNRDLALLASMSTTIFDTLRIEINDLESNPSFDVARQDFFTDGTFDVPFEPIAFGVESALHDPANQTVLGTDDVVTAARTGTLQGRVTDARGQPVGDVRVVVSQNDVDVAVPDNPAITDGDGHFRIRSIPVGDTTVKAFLGEFEVLRVTTTVVAVVTVNLEIAPTSELEPRPSALVFSDVEVGAARVVTLRLSNNGLADLTLGGLAIEGSGASAFRFRRRPVLPVVVSAGSEVTVDIGYEPTEVHADLATLRVESDATNAPVLEVPLIGTSVERSVPQIELSRTQLAFGEVQLNAFRTQSMVVSNSGTASLTIHAVTLEAAAESGFILERLPALPAILPPNGELALRVRFQPTRTGVSRGVVRIQSDAEAASSRTVAVNGTGVEAPVPEITATPSVLEFGAVQINIPGEALPPVTRTTMLHNTGTADLTLTAIRVDSSQGNAFRLARHPTLPLTIIPGGALTLEVQYRPSVVGSVTGAVRIRSDAANLDDLTIALNGTGVDTRVPRIAVSPPILDYGEVDIGTFRQLSLDVTNMGTGDLEITRLELQSPAGPVFQLHRPPETPFTLGRGATQRLYVQFRPNEAGYATGALRVHNNDMERPQYLISLRGEGVPEPTSRIEVEPVFVDFADVQIGSRRQLPVRIANTGTSSLHVTELRVDGGPSGAFTLADNPAPVTVIAGGSLEVSVNFAPAEEGSVTGTLSVGSDADNADSIRVPLSGTGLAEPLPQIDVRPDIVEFPEVAIGASRVEKVTIRNIGTDALILTALDIDGGEADEFRVQRAPTLPVTVLPEGAIEVLLAYVPATAGSSTGTLTIASNDPQTPIAILPLSGVGAPVPMPQVAASTVALSFDEVEVGSARERAVTITNVGNATLTIHEIHVESEPAGVFALADVLTNEISVAPQSEVSLGVVFAPETVGRVTGTLQVRSDAANADILSVSLDGTGTAVPMPTLTVSPAVIDFGALAIGQSSVLTVTMRNEGTAELTISALELLAADGADGTSFELRDSPELPAVVPPNTTVTAEISFIPSTEGSATGTFKIASDDSHSPTVLPVSGEALPETPPETPAQLTVSPSPMDFGEVLVGSNRTIPVTATNSGTAPLVISAITIVGADFTLGVGAAPATLQPNETLTFEVTYQPSAPGASSGVVRISNDTAEKPVAEIPLSGTGTVPGIAVDPAAVAFGDVVLGQSEVMPVTLTNPGTADLNISSVTVQGAAFSVSGVPAGGTTLSPGASLTVTVTFAPVQGGEASGFLQIVSDAPASPTQVLLSGNGLPVSIAVSPENLAYGSVLLEGERELELTISNPSDGVLSVSAIRVNAGTDVGFALSEPFAGPVDVVPHGAFTVALVFTPLEVGDVVGSVEIESNAVEGLVTVPLSGRGEAVPTARLVAEPEVIDFGDVTRNDTQTQQLTLHNDGDGRLTVNAIALTAGGNVGFAIVEGPNEAFEIVPGGAVVVVVSFTPGNEGRVTGNIQVRSNAENAPTLDVPLSGTGIAQPMALIDVAPPNEVDFGSVELQQTRMATLTITNNGDADLTLDRVSVPTGTDVGFAIEGGPIENVVLGTGATLEVMVTFTPVAEGMATGLIRVESNADNEPVVERSLRGTGTAIPAPAVTVTPMQISFSNTAVGDQMTAEVQIANTGDADLTVSDVVIAEGETAGFGVTEAPDVATVLAPGEVLTVTAVFAPVTSGLVTGTLSVLSDASNGTAQLVSLQGTGESVPELGVPELAVSPLSIDFGDILVGSRGTAEVRIENTGTSTLNVDPLAIRGDTAAFAIGNDTAGPFSLEPGEAVAVGVSFTPSQVGGSSATLAINSNANQTPNATVELLGQGVVAMIDVQPPSLSFAPQEIGRSQTLSIQVLNSGTGTLDLASVSIGEPSFVLGAVPESVAPGASETIEVIFMPNRGGDILGELTIANNSENAPQVAVRLSGTGIVPTGAGLLVLPTALTFDDTAIHESRSLSVTVSSVGLTAVTLSGLDLGATVGFVLGESPTLPITLAPGETATIGVVFTPDAPGPFSGQLQIVSDDVNDPVTNVTLNGIGVEAIAAPNGQPK